MQKEFQQFIENNRLCQKHERILLAVSGGIDSITMAHLFLKAGYNCAIAHCNFQLRSSESDGDQQFVEDFALTHKIDCHTIKFDTSNYAKKNKLSIQMAARDLRYNWFEKIANENGFTKIAVAHNLNDVVETFFINLTRSTGLKGLTGINPKNGKIIRPLLFATRNKIIEFARSNKLNYREDSTNTDSKYLRNAIRHKIIPEFEALNPSFLESISHTTTILNEVHNSYSEIVNQLKNKLIHKKGELIIIDIKSLKDLNLSSVNFFDIISEYGFNYENAVRILQNIDNQPGMVFYSKGYKLVKDRTSLIITKISETINDEFLIMSSILVEHLPIDLKFETLQNNASLQYKADNNIAWFDQEKIFFPLKLRRWKEGDFFYPFGMEGSKKLSDYFTDNKFSIIDKENTWLLVAGDDIIWIVNHRSDNRYRVTKNTKLVLQIQSIS